MGNYIWTALLLAADEGQAAAEQPQGSWLVSLMPFLVIMILFWLLLIRPQRREQAKREELLRAVKPNDRVITVGGIYGVVTAVQREIDSVTIRVDDSNNTKIKVSTGAIARVLGDEPSAPSSK